jgi:hypothetical protein
VEKSWIDIFTVGLIPITNRVDRIISGDPEESGTQEVTVIVNDSGDIEVLETGRVIKASAEDLYRADSGSWEDLASEILSVFSSAEIVLTGPELALVCSELMMEPSPDGVESKSFQL